LEPLEASGDKRRYFHATYQRTTVAVAEELKRGGFADPDWVERWDVAFADLCDRVQRTGRAAAAAARAARHERAHQLRPAAGAGGGDHRRAVRRRGAARPPGGRPPGDR